MAQPTLRSRAELRERILGLLRSDTALTRAELARAAGAPERRIREALADLVRIGHPILSTGGGFRYGGSAEEVSRAARRLRAAAVSILRRVSALEQITAPTVARQLALELEGARP